MNSGFDGILLIHYHRYPAMQLVDVYKLLHQASQGSEHAVSDRLAARRWLTQELVEMGPGPDEPLLDPIAPDGNVLRLHLRPFLAQAGDPEMLLAAFLHTANDFRGSTTALESAWTGLIRLVGAGELPFSLTQAQSFGREMAARDYPAVHHSEIYRAAYRPAYRVIASEFWLGA